LSSRPNAPYWRANVRLVAALLTVWAAVSFGAAILFGERLDRIRVGGFRLGFWIAQQGSIYLYVLLILIYVVVMNRLDRRHDVDERDRRR
jgi:putative solute:sodium symporter small subunit